MDNIIVESTDISYEQPVTIQGLNNDQPFNAKIDTGADVCSLHATDISVNNQMVSFVVNNRRYSMPISKMQSIKQADSNTEQRPVVTLTFVVSDQTIENIECNLNDRSGMSSDLLIGRNLLDKHDFVIHTMQQNNNVNMESQTTTEQPIVEDEQPQETTHSRLMREMAEVRISLQQIMQKTYEINEMYNQLMTGKDSDK